MLCSCNALVIVLLLIVVFVCLHSTENSWSINRQEVSVLISKIGKRYPSCYVLCVANSFMNSFFWSLNLLTYLYITKLYCQKGSVRLQKYMYPCLNKDNGEKWPENVLDVLSVPFEGFAKFNLWGVKLFKELKLSLNDKKNGAQSSYYEQLFIVCVDIFFTQPGLGKSLNSTIALPLEQAALKFSLP